MPGAGVRTVLAIVMGDGTAGMTGTANDCWTGAGAGEGELAD